MPQNTIRFFYGGRSPVVIDRGPAVPTTLKHAFSAVQRIFDAKHTVLAMNLTGFRPTRPRTFRGGGNVPANSRVSEQYLLDLERGVHEPHRRGEVAGA